MQENEFRSWLRQRDVKGKLTTNSITRRMAAVRGIERKVGNLDEAYSRDKLQAVTALLTFGEADAAEGRSPPANLVGQSANPIRYLRTLRAFLGNYRQFLDAQHGENVGAWTATDDEALEADEEADDAPPAPDRPLNQILFGPPGTGKTYETAKLAVEICSGVAPENRDELMQAYRALQGANRIAFTTFHQSIGYEEFVEGLRPVTDADDDEEPGNTPESSAKSAESPGKSAGFRLEPKNGIFRRICELADVARKRGGRAAAYDFEGRAFYKMSLGRANGESHIADAALAGDYIILGWGAAVDWSDSKYVNYDAVSARWREIEPDASGNSGNIAQIWRFRSMKPGDLVLISQGNNRVRAVAEVVGDYEYLPQDSEWNHRRAVKWLAQFDPALPVDAVLNGKFTQASCYGLNPNRIKRDALAELIGGSAGGPPEQFVLIIDEINRANVSKVLGELITLLEDDKRLGRGNALTVRLPYSGDEFGIPENLHVIGTMNTADRSIALLDTALRRRFHFVEMQPNYARIEAEIEGVRLADLLSAINGRVEWLFDRDHQIGHAELINVRTKDQLDEVMRRKIIPLLVEYFYEDWEKVRAVLNDREERFISRTKLSVPTMIQDAGDERFRYGVAVGPIDLEAYQACLLV